jgi:hypothetical protein
MKMQIPAFSLFLFSSLGFVKNDNATLEFKVYIKPNLTYTQVSKNTSHSVTTYLCSQNCLNELENKGIVNPTIKDNIDEHTTIMKSGSVNGSGAFPVIINTDNAFFKRSKNKITDKILVYAHCVPESFPAIDSISAAAKLSLETKAMLRETLEGSFSQLNLPEKRLEIQDTFTRKNLIKIALGSGNMQVELITTYKLVAIISGIAYFTTTEAYSCKMDMSNAKSSFSGNGGGKFSFNIGSNYYVSYQTSDTLYMHVKYDDTLSTNVVSVNGYSVITTITKE